MIGSVAVLGRRLELEAAVGLERRPDRSARSATSLAGIDWPMTVSVTMSWPRWAGV